MRWLTAAVLMLLLAAASKTSADPDLWGHLRFGLDTLHTHALSRVDPYSFTQDVPWINHEWLSEVQMAIAYRASGVAGLALLKGMLALGAVLLVWTALRGADPAARMLVAGTVIVGCGWVLQNLRPQLWSLLLLAILGRTLTSERWTARRWIPLLFLFWANLHGGWIVGLAVTGIWAFIDVGTTRRHAVEWTIIVAASAAATLATPYGIDLWRFLWTTVHFTRDIDEWRPLWTWPAVNWIGWIAATAAALWFSVRPHRFRWPALAVAIVLAVASLRVSRLTALFVMTTVVCFAPVIRDRWRARAPMAIGIANVRRAGAMAALVCAAAALLVGWQTLSCLTVSGAWVAPANGAAALRTAQPGRLVTFFDWGEYAIWHLGPRLRVSMDGRRETVYSDRRLDEHDAIVNGTTEGLAALAAWQAEYVWLPARSRATRVWLADHGYRIDVSDDESFVAVRADLPKILATPGAARLRCFPL